MQANRNRLRHRLLLAAVTLAAAAWGTAAQADYYWHRGSGWRWYHGRAYYGPPAVVVAPPAVVAPVPPPVVVAPPPVVVAPPMFGIFIR